MKKNFSFLSAVLRENREKKCVKGNIVLKSQGVFTWDIYRKPVAFVVGWSNNRPTNFYIACQQAILFFSIQKTKPEKQKFFPAENHIKDFSAFLFISSIALIFRSLGRTNSGILYEFDS